MTGGALIGGGSLPLLQRGWELEQITAALEAARGGEGSLVVIAGAAGTGKTALLAAAVSHAHEQGFVVRPSRGSELEQELSFGGIRQLFEPLLRSASAEERQRLLSGAAAPAARLFANAPLDCGASGDGGFAMLHGLYWLAAGLSADAPAALVVDDAHWIDAPTLRALNYLAGRLADVAIALFVALRPHEPSSAERFVEELASQPVARRLELSELGPATVGEIVRTAIPDASEDVRAAFHESSRGNPFYLRELLRSVVVANGDPPSAIDVRRAAVASVGDRVMRRVETLGPHAPPLAAAMAVLGSSGALRDAAALCEQGDLEAADAARAMRRVEILAAEDPFEWIHPLVWRSVYDSLTVAERDLLHGRAADVLVSAGASAGAVAVHLSALRPTGSDRVVAGLLAAADEALVLDAPEVAVAALRRALTEGAAQPPRATLMLRLGQVEVLRRDHPAATEALREVLELSTDPHERALASIALTESQIHTCQWEAAAVTIAAALEEDDGCDPALTLELEMVHAIDCALDPNLVDGFWARRDRLLTLSQDDSWAGRALSALFVLVYAFRGESLEQVLPLCDRALSGGVLLAERGAGAWVPAHILEGLVVVEAHERAVAFADDVESAARRQGSVHNGIAAKGFRGRVAASQGDLAGAEEILRPLLDTTLANGMLLALVTALWWMVDVILERPSPEVVAMIESLDLPEAVMDTPGGAWLMLSRGRVRALRGQRTQAARDLRAAGSILDRLGFGPTHDPWRSALALILPTANIDEARALVEEELVRADSSGLPRPRGIVRRAAGLLAGGDEGVEILRESVAMLSGSPARYEHARSLVELGAALRRSGRRGDAREPLEAGMELGQLCGAERLVGRAHDELLAAGFRPRRIVRSGFTALTASERRIVRLASEGRSNPEIAQSLYVSIKTVETHLSHAYRKLDLSGPGARRGLPDLVAHAS